LAPILARIDDIEATLYHQIARERVAVIEALTEKVDANAREAVIAKHLFDHLWLLDPSWERAATTEFMEQRVATEFGKIEAGLTRAEREGRIDIKYRTTSGKHVVIELKRSERLVTQEEISEQLRKYLEAIEKILEAQQEREPVEGVVVLGRLPAGWDRTQTRERGEKALAAQNIRVVLYDSLIENASEAYRDFTNAKRTTSELASLLEAIASGEN
jgi:hypothetical protein